MKQTKKSKVANKKTTKVVKVKKRKITSMVKSVDKKIKKPTKITSFKKIVKNETPKKNKKLKLDITYELRSAGKGSPRREELAKLTGGSSQCPYLIDPNTDIQMPESKDIVGKNQTLCCM